MAGDWIKFEENTPDKPEVHGMAQDLGIEADAVVGKLIRVWCWASRNCPVSGRTDVRALSAIDRVAFTPGFAKAMHSAGWLIIEGEEVTFPNFDRHTSQTAKERALDQKRKRQSRQNPSGTCPVVNRTETGPEKRREENIHTTPIVPKGDDRAEEIYDAYPRKIAKQAALKAIDRALKAKPADDLLAATRAFAVAVAQWPESERQYIPHPATWFNRGSYEDDPAQWVRAAQRLTPHASTPAPYRQMDNLRPDYQR